MGMSIRKMIESIRKVGGLMIDCLVNFKNHVVHGKCVKCINKLVGSMIDCFVACIRSYASP